MKKIYAFILSCVLLLSVSTTAFAYDGNYTGWGESELTAYAYSSFTVTIPATVDLTHGGGQVIVSDADLDAGYQVVVTVTNLNENGNIDMVHKTKEGITSECSLSNSMGTLSAENTILAIIKDTDIQSDGNGYADFFGQMVGGSKAGGYTGTMRYNIYCDPYQ